MILIVYDAHRSQCESIFLRQKVPLFKKFSLLMTAAIGGMLIFLTLDCLPVV